ncbi:MAG: type II toxin-antitoxin system VapC family toxin [Chloroflexota bacterium]|nr:type II toxin-antitoxin system VapC family toxin [Chloroflexota bacterium]
MIILDTHIWIWWVHNTEQLSNSQKETIAANELAEIGISAISLWEIAKLVEYGRLELPCSIDAWFEKAISYPGIRIIGITPEIAIESTQLPGKFHRDPADQIIVATARISDCSLVTSDSKILDYSYVASVE